MGAREGGRNVRLLRVAETIRHALSATLSRGDIADPDVAGHLVTVSAVECSPDLRHADVFVVPLMGADAEAVLKGLSRAAPHFRGLLARQLTLKYLPQLHFKLDESFGEGDRIETILRSDKVRRDLDQADTLDDGNDEDAPA